jgi:hypothetical protein
MTPGLRYAYQRELNAARAAELAGNAHIAFHHLERAHILSQRHTLQHVYVHWLMLRLGVSTRAMPIPADLRKGVGACLIGPRKALQRR